MTLYTVTQPDPPPGTDFTFTVPGRYLYDVVGITAQLNTGGAVPSVAADSSGYGFDGAYSGPGPVATFGAGLLAGDVALQISPWNAFTYSPVVTVPSPLNSPWASGFTIAFLIRSTAGLYPIPFVWSQQSSGTGQGWFFEVHYDPLQPIIYVSNSVSWWVTVNIPALNDGNTHMIAATWDGVTVVIYFDGAAQALNATGAAPAGIMDSTLAYPGSSGDPSAAVLLGRVAAYNAPLTAGQVAGIDAAKGAAAGYDAAVLGAGPLQYYKLDDAPGPSTGRQPSLIVTNGTTELAAVPTGFPAVATPGPYEYSWQPALNADVQSTDGTLTTVAIPQLLLPAGYTVGPRTLDIQPTDQWSNVALWWDDAYQGQLDPYGNYLFGGGIHLTYHQIGT